MIDVTERAAARIQQVLAEGPARYAGLRVGLTDGGCSGYTYLLEFEADPDEDDLVFERDGAKVFVHPLHLPYLDGSALDWEDGDLQSGFQLKNPNVKRVCGCGESFDV
ncbi:MAG: iron-sulfur cluster assembly accessory protein [Myxococcota bacterium]